MATEKKDQNLHQRIAAVAAKVGQIKPSGKNQYNAQAISIDDVEAAIQPAFAEQGITTSYTHIERPESLDAGQWLVALKVTVFNADEPEQVVEGITYDTGGNVSAAVSYALKRFYKGLLHIGDEVDGHGNQQFTGGVRPIPRRENGQSEPTNLEKQLAASVEAAKAPRPTPQPTRPYRRPDAQVVGPSNAPTTPRQGRLLNDEEPPPPSDADAPPGVRR